MSQDTYNDNMEEVADELNSNKHSDYKPVNRFDASAVHHLSGMFQNWFLDYASYVILERAVPNIADGLKPVQRRILHSMKRMDDGRYNKVANIVGHTMQFHPHGDASIGDALVQIGQKGLLVETQGNWGNILTGDRAAAPRYIEARLSKFALEVVFNPKTTEWQMSYDGRNKEPIALPAKFPLLLAGGAEGIAVGLSSKILPHNISELCSAAIHYLKGEQFKLYPDFPTGGSIDASRYNDGARGGVVKIRAKIEKIDSRTLAIREIPYSKTTTSLIESILRAIEKGKIKAKRVDDNTAAEVEILVHLAPGVSPDKTIDALYAFSDCEISISPNCCVIRENKPCFLSVSDVLKYNVDYTRELLRKELTIKQDELLEQLFFSNLERIFIEERIYKDKKFEAADDMDIAIEHVMSRLNPFTKDFIREVTRDDILRLMEIKMQRILKFSKQKADELIAKIKAELQEIERDLSDMRRVTIRWYQGLLDKYGKEYPRLTEIRSFETIEATKVVEANEKLYINRSEGFIGTGLKKDEFVCNCSDIDDIIIFYKNGKYKVVRIADKIFVGKNIQHLQVYKKNDRRTTYNVVYRDGGKTGYSYIKRFNVPGVTRDKEYDLTQGTPESKILYFSANPNGEAEIIKITLDPTVQLKKIFVEYDFSKVLIKGRASRGNVISKRPINRISLKSHGHSTLGGRKVWWDKDVARINYDEHGILLGEFHEGDMILVVLENSDFYLTNFDINNHYEADIKLIEKWDENKVWSAVLFDADNGNQLYIKRFKMEATRRKQNFIGENTDSRLLKLTDEMQPRMRLIFGGADAFREPLDVDIASFVGIKGFKAKGKRVTTFKVEAVEALESLADYNTEDIIITETEEISNIDNENLDPDKEKSEQEVRDEITGQLNLFLSDKDKNQ